MKDKLYTKQEDHSTTNWCIGRSEIQIGFGVKNRLYINKGF